MVTSGRSWGVWRPVCGCQKGILRRSGKETCNADETVHTDSRHDARGHAHAEREEGYQITHDTARPTNADLTHAVRNENQHEACKPMDDCDRAVHHRGTPHRAARISRGRRRRTHVTPGK